MNRYTPASQLQLQVFGRIPSVGRIAQGALLAATHDLAPPDQIAGAMTALVDLCLLSTLRHTTADGVTQTLYWRTGLKPIVPPTQEELSRMTESKTARLLRLIAAHGPIDSIALSAKANAEGANIPVKNLAGLLAASIKAGTVVTSRPGKYTLFQMAPAEPVAQASSLPTADAGDYTPPPADPALLALANRELINQISAAQAGQQESERAFLAANAALADICRSLDVFDAAEAVAEIEHLQKLADARTDQDMGDLVRYRAQLDLITDRLGCDTHNGIPAVIDSLLATRDASGGRLALLTTHDMVGAVLDYLEPYISEDDARRLLLTRVNRGDLAHCVLVRALFQARRQITYGPIEAPAIETLRG